MKWMTKEKRQVLAAAVAGVGLGWVSTSVANAALIDAILGVDENDETRLVTGGFIDASGTFDVLPKLTFRRNTENFGLDMFFGDLGYRGNPLPDGLVSMPPLIDVHFDIVSFEIDTVASNLWFWDGSGEVDFSPVTDGRTLTVSKAPAVVNSATADGSATDVTGFVIDRTSDEGGLHRHIDVLIDDTDDDLGTTFEGIYAVALRYSIDATSLTPAAVSDPSFYLFNVAAPSGSEEAPQIHTAEQFFLEQVVPEPGSVFAVAGIGGLLWARGMRVAGRRR